MTIPPTTELVRRTGAPTDSYTTTYSYDDAGNQSSATTPTGATIRRAFNAASEQTSITDPLLRTTMTTYNLAGQPTKLTLPGDAAGTNGPSIVLAYDQAGHPTRTEQRSSAGSTLAATTTAYDAFGNLVASTDADGHTTTMTYDALGRPKQHTEPVATGQSITTDFAYDLAGHRTAYTDGNRNTTYYTFNTLGLPESTIEPATSAYPNLSDRTYTTAYDALSRPTTLTEPGGVTITSSYDAADHITNQSGTGSDVPTPTRTLGYDLDGRLTSNSSPSGTQTYTYDDRGLPATSAGPTGNASYTYDANGQLTTFTNPTGITTYTYDTAGQLKTLADPLTGNTLTYSYTNRGQVNTVQYGTGDTRTYTYDDQGNTTSDTLKTPSGTTVASLAYTYYPSGRLKTKATAGVAGATSHTYTYDQAGRLGTWNNGTSTTTYGYDGNGNLTANGVNTATYNERNQLTTTGTSTYTYTPRGTRSTVTAGSNTTISAYDAFDRLVGQGGQTYAYDGLGRLIQSPGHTFTYDGATSTLTSDGTENYTRAPGGALTALGTAATAAFAYTDRHGDLIGTFTATSTTPAGSAAYDPWGKPTNAAGTSHNVGYQGGWTDATTNQVNTTSRWYDPATAGFTSRDTANLAPESATAGNRYAYANADPLTFADTSGHSPCISVPPYLRGGGGNGGNGPGYSLVELDPRRYTTPTRHRDDPDDFRRAASTALDIQSALANAYQYQITHGSSGSYDYLNTMSTYGGLGGAGVGAVGAGYGFFGAVGAGISSLGSGFSLVGFAALSPLSYDSCESPSKPKRLDRTEIEPGSGHLNSDNTPAQSSLNGQEVGATNSITPSAINPGAVAQPFQVAQAAEAQGRGSSNRRDEDDGLTCLDARREGAEDNGSGWIYYAPLDATTKRSQGAVACLTPDHGVGTSAQGNIAGWEEANKKALQSFPDGKNLVDRCHLIPAEHGGRGVARNLAPCWSYPTNKGIGSQYDIQLEVNGQLSQNRIVEFSVLNRHKYPKSTIPESFEYEIVAWDPDGTQRYFRNNIFVVNRKGFVDLSN
ncbi:RHS repeat-associated core domain-containing protein [Kitasatospora sp. KL5]|uniref:RHS repeat-associated core domain-containing protein n=1 Tax=Kitasatospora sp. KL5 TaxID=3425125 RepID=UPI003D6FEFD8